MKIGAVILIMLLVLAVPAYADSYTAPEPSGNAQALMPYEGASFGEGLWHVITTAFSYVYPSIHSCLRTCYTALAMCILISVIREFPGNISDAVDLAGVVGAACILFAPTNALITEAADTVVSLAEYGKVLLPVLATSLAAQGGSSTATGLYVGTAVFNSVLGVLISRILVPLVYFFLAIGVGKAAISSTVLDNMKKFLISAAGKCLRIALYIITGYLSITGVVGGATDQITLKATKLTISGMVPVIGNIMADASETILVSAAVVKNAVGVYGLWSAVAICIGPFLNIGAQYLSLKATQSICTLCGSKQIPDLIGDFASAMGLLLAMTGTMCLLLLISTVCFMKGIG